MANKAIGDGRLRSPRVLTPNVPSPPAVLS